MVSGCDADSEQMMRVNQANWDARTPIPVSSRFYGLNGTVRSADWFADFEWTDLGELGGRDVMHLQCHLGTETVVFAERGARTVGLDISPESIKRARRLTERVRPNSADAAGLPNACVPSRHVRPLLRQVVLTVRATGVRQQVSAGHGLGKERGCLVCYGS
jgi:hypothetical protein